MKNQKKKEKVTAKEKHSIQNKGENNKLFYVILVSIPFFFFILLELGLRIFGYGEQIEQWSDTNFGKRLLNPAVTRKYFHVAENAPFPIPDMFDQEKKTNAFRIFVLGESSAAGYPYLPNGSFSKYLQQRLEQNYPNSVIEVVNVGITAINSYTIRDLFPGIIEQKPDLVIIYTGHNEYYGALGVGSAEFIGGSRTLVNLALWLERFRTFQLVRNILKEITGTFTGTPQTSDGTLMARIAKDQMITLNSDVFKAGISQFEGNMRDILEEAKENNIPVIFSNLVSNLRDQKPFISVKENDLPSADEIYSKAQKEYYSGNYSEAKKLFKYAKDLDALKFRASEELNSLIKKLSIEYNCKFVDLEKKFEEASPNQIIGDNLMTDHLHPNLAGFQLMGNTYYQSISEMGLLPKENPTNNDDKVQHRITSDKFKFTPLDSVLAVFRIIQLKSDWPYVKEKVKKPISELFVRNNKVDSVAFDIIQGNSSWDKGHYDLGLYYLNNGELDKFVKEFETALSQYSLDLDKYDILINAMIQNLKLDDVYPYLQKRNSIQPTSETTKWLGIINLSKNKIPEAISYLEQNRREFGNDPQVLYNLSGAYYQQKNIEKTLEYLNLALKIDPDYQEAKIFRQQLTGR